MIKPPPRCLTNTPMISDCGFTIFVACGSCERCAAENIQKGRVMALSDGEIRSATAREAELLEDVVSVVDRSFSAIVEYPPGTFSALFE